MQKEKYTATADHILRTIDLVRCAAKVSRDEEWRIVMHKMTDDLNVAVC